MPMIRPEPPPVVQVFDELSGTVNVSVSRMPEIEEARARLPILGEGRAIVEAVLTNDVVIIDDR
jgi:HrpA-like RNA helicase